MIMKKYDLSTHDFIDYILAMCVTFEIESINLQDLVDVIYDISKHSGEEYDYVFRKYRFEEKGGHIYCDKIDDELAAQKTTRNIRKNFTYDKKNKARNQIDMGIKTAKDIMKKHEKDFHLYRLVYAIVFSLQ